jgi:hypothetical protein
VNAKLFLAAKVATNSIDLIVLIFFEKRGAVSFAVKVWKILLLLHPVALISKTVKARTVFCKVDIVREIIFADSNNATSSGSKLLLPTCVTGLVGWSFVLLRKLNISRIISVRCCPSVRSHISRIVSKESGMTLGA